jgi:hypothetical protein
MQWSFSLFSECNLIRRGNEYIVSSVLSRKKIGCGESRRTENLHACLPLGKKIKIRPHQQLVAGGWWLVRSY